MKRNIVQKEENMLIKKTISLLSIRLGNTDLMIGCWMSQMGATNPYIQKRVFSTNF
jgi:hypothetical protein